MAIHARRTEIGFVSTHVAAGTEEPFRWSIQTPAWAMKMQEQADALMNGQQHDYASILTTILEQYHLPLDGDHGVHHWARVWTNGHAVGQTNGADLEVVSLFALFHDACRENEFHDPGHGLRGGRLARKLRGTHVHLDDRRFELLYEACRLHTDGLTSGEPTLLACWDADRLDLGRVGIEPVPSRLGTEAARGLIAWAHERAISGHEPAEVFTLWEANRFFGR